jgi:hypothetical protein
MGQIIQYKLVDRTEGFTFAAVCQKILLRQRVCQGLLKFANNIERVYLVYLDCHVFAARQKDFFLFVTQKTSVVLAKDLIEAHFRFFAKETGNLDYEYQTYHINKNTIHFRSVKKRFQKIRLRIQRVK